MLPFVVEEEFAQFLWFAHFTKSADFEEAEFTSSVFGNDEYRCSMEELISILESSAVDAMVVGYQN